MNKIYIKISVLSLLFLIHFNINAREKCVSMRKFLKLQDLGFQNCKRNTLSDDQKKLISNNSANGVVDFDKVARDAKNWNLYFMKYFVDENAEPLPMNKIEDIFNNYNQMIKILKDENQPKARPKYLPRKLSINKPPIPKNKPSAAKILERRKTISSINKRAQSRPKIKSPKPSIAPPPPPVTAQLSIPAPPPPPPIFVTTNNSTEVKVDNKKPKQSPPASGNNQLQNLLSDIRAGKKLKKVDDLILPPPKNYEEEKSITNALSGAISTNFFKDDNFDNDLNGLKKSKTTQQRMLHIGILSRGIDSYDVDELEELKKELSEELSNDGHFEKDKNEITSVIRNVEKRILKVEKIIKEEDEQWGD